MAIRNKIPCVILAGGKGSRLDGKGKYLELLNKLPLWQHVYDKVKCQFDTTVINVKRKEKSFVRGVVSVQLYLTLRRCHHGLCMCLCDRINIH